MNINHIFHCQVDSNTEGTFGDYKYSLSLKKNPGPSDPSLIYFKSEDSSGYQIEGLSGFFLLGSIRKRESNLDLWVISLMSPTGRLVSCDFIGQGSASKVWNNFSNRAWVSFEDLPASYLGD